MSEQHQEELLRSIALRLYLKTNLIDCAIKFMGSSASSSESKMVIWMMLKESGNSLLKMIYLNFFKNLQGNWL